MGEGGGYNVTGGNLNKTYSAVQLACPQTLILFRRGNHFASRREKSWKTRPPLLTAQTLGTTGSCWQQCFASLGSAVLSQTIVMATNSAMETDDSSHLPSSNLRRSNSAPMIGGANVNDNAPVFQPQLARQRRFSTSQMAINGVSSVFSFWWKEPFFLFNL